MCAIRLVAEGLALEWNCDGCPDLDLSEFNPLKRQLVRFDESTPKMVLRQNQFFNVWTAKVHEGLQLQIAMPTMCGIVSVCS